MIKESDFFKVLFVKSITNISQKPDKILPEVAFAGRSNVGKSSMLNGLFQRKNLVKTSSTPGKTQLINYFNVNDKFYCVDLPGYGYAKISKSKKEKWQPMIEGFLVNNMNLKMIYVLVDSRHDIMDNDKEMLVWLDHIGLRYTIILSKIDKISKNDLSGKINTLKKNYPENTIIAYSFKDKQIITKMRQQVIADIC